MSNAVKNDTVDDFLSGYALGKRDRSPRRAKPGSRVSRAFLRGNDAGQLAAVVGPLNADKGPVVNPDSYP